MSKIILTKKQAEFIEGFKKLQYSDNNKKVEVEDELPTWAGHALHNLMQFGFGDGLRDANGKNLNNAIDDKETDFKHDQVPLLIEAIMHGYEVKEKNVVLYIEFDDKNDMNRKLYYGAGIHVTNKLTATEYDLNVEWEDRKVKELKAQGWKVEEV